MVWHIFVTCSSLTGHGLRTLLVKYEPINQAKTGKKIWVLFKQRTPKRTPVKPLQPNIGPMAKYLYLVASNSYTMEQKERLVPALLVPAQPQGSREKPFVTSIARFELSEPGAFGIVFWRIFWVCWRIFFLFQTIISHFEFGIITSETWDVG